jgi:hypothetical protein
LTVYRSIYRTNPDHVIVDFVPKLGVVRYVYEHHGTVSSVDVKLVKVMRRRDGRLTARKPPNKSSLLSKSWELN